MNQRFLSKRQGTTATEVIVAATLLLGTIGLVVPTTVRSGRIWQESRHYQIAMNELSNQFEYLSSLNQAELKLAVTQLQVSSEASASLQDARLEASLTDDGGSLRVTLSLNWGRGAQVAPLKLVGWLSSAANATATTAQEANSLKENSNEAA